MPKPMSERTLRLIREHEAVQRQRARLSDRKVAEARARIAADPELRGLFGQVRARLPRDPRRDLVIRLRPNERGDPGNGET